ncbi:uncharacterized protein LOC118430049 [Branchiostoma floridae]|uniref:Uncharacterized protein LOC118430049 n=1 Tax=Branchiostoma floridae TaxID=7739 RepID=A0A9J7NAD7_BRAFL|nr:uncharacterized protein LOC118430049 [Branchiostoma floridae]
MCLLPVSGTDAASVTFDVVAIIIGGVMIYGVFKVTEKALELANTSVSGTDAASVTFDVVAIIIGGVMIYGVFKAVSVLLFVWVVVVVIILVAELIIVIVITAFARGPEVLIPAWIIYLLILGLVIYGVLVVYSHYENLRNGDSDDSATPPPSGPTHETAVSPPGSDNPQIWSNATSPAIYEMDRTRV